MTTGNLIISPKTKVGELLDAYPQLENILLELSPAFAKLKNPILRKTVGRIATLQQAAAVGGLKTDELVNRLRKEAGQNELAGETGGESYWWLQHPTGSMIQKSPFTMMLPLLSIQGEVRCRKSCHAGKLQSRRNP